MTDDRLIDPPLPLRPPTEEESWALVCVTYGHVRQGLGCDTNNIIWARYCSRCGADLGGAA